MRWDFSDGLDRDALAVALSQHLDVWSEGFAWTSGDAKGRRVWGGTWNLSLLWWVVLQTGTGCFVLFLSPCRCVQRAEFGVLAAAPVHVGVDNLNVVRHVDRLIQGSFSCAHFELLNDGDLLHLVTMRVQTNSNDFGVFSELIRRFEFEFCRRENFF